VRACVIGTTFTALPFFLKSEGIINVYIDGVVMNPQQWPMWLLHDTAGRRGLECRKRS
jgi:hypothetical protein